MTVDNYQRYKIKCEGRCETIKNGVVKLFEMLKLCKGPVQDGNYSCTRDSECQWIACDSAVCCRKNLTCITPERVRPYTMSGKSPNTKLSSIIKAKLKFSEPLLPLNVNDAVNGNNCSSSAIKCTQCSHTIHDLDEEENISYYHCPKSSCVCTPRRHNMYPINSSRRSWSFRDGWFHFLILVLMFTSSLCVGANELSAETDLAYTNKSDVCRDNYDIRNDPQQFNKLRGCRVIEGYLQILLFDNYNESSYEGISFPELREINDYLMLYRVFGLRTLSKLFPNLAVIGGKRRFQNYALIIYEMQDMQEIGLVSLTDILEGAVRIEKNPQLCYTSTIDWTLIAKKAKRDEHMILENKKANECPSCPGVDTELSHGLRCPESSHEHHSTTKSRRLCWNQHHCQKVCPSRCNGTCDDRGGCCDAKCIAGCSGSSTNCTACRHYRLGHTRDFKCVETCPANTLVFQGRRCITEQECRDMPSPRGLTFLQSSGPLNYKSFNNSCILLCPNNYIQTEKQDGNLTCEPCSDYNDCRKECDGGVVDNISSAQKLKYCTHIKQSLEIKIIGAMNIVKELEENLAMIQEIKGYLKVVRSYPLVSLNFLKSLKSIKGELLENNQYSLVVMDNANLQDLWDWDKHEPIKIERGNFSFHFNPKLCVNKIHKLRNITTVLRPSAPPEIDQNSNGDRVPCDVRPLEVSVSKISKFAAIIQWEPFKFGDQRVLLGYVVSRMKAPFQNVTVYDGRDACGGDGWIVKDVAISQPKKKEEDSDHPKSNDPSKKTTSTEDEEQEPFTHIFTHLEPYTQYAFYVKTYTLASETIGAQSPVLYFTTKPDQPSPPLKMAVHSNSSSQLVVKWEPPLKPNGNVTHYILEVKYQPDVNDRNYCKDVIKPEEVQVSNTHDVTTPSTTEQACDCASELENKPKIIDQAQADSIISFEDQLQDQVYVKFVGNTNDRYKRMIPHSDMVMAKERYSEAAQKPFEANSSSGANSNSSIHLYIRTNATTYVIKDLNHFALYSINLRACRERVDEDEDDKLCSESKIRNERTLELEGADDIKVFKVEVLQTNQSLGEVEITWEEPEKPNGLIYTYQIEYNRVDLVDAKPIPICVTHQDFIERRRYVVQKLTPGNYSIHVMAVSKAGNGKFSEMKYFLIQEASSSPSAGAIAGYVLLSLCLLAGLVLAGCYVHRQLNPPPAIKLITSVNPEYMSMQYQPDEWEVPREKIKLLHELGQGSFGMVYEGIAYDLVRNNPEIKCAIKTVNEHATDRERIEFLNEASVMKAFDTAHVVRLLGVVSRGQPTLVVMELMANGDLKSYLRSHRPDAETYDPEVGMQPPSLKRILQMAMEIADGMAYLSAKKFVHRDLAARNCMVSDNLTVKIGDFGMTRDIYETDYYRKGSKGLLPVRWMAPESLKDGVFTSSSDVWSYGVVLWEMATLASQPYQGLSNDQVLRYVIDGGVMERPENCPDQLYELMRLTWQHKPGARPSFFELEALLQCDANPEFRKISFYHSPQGQEALVNMQNTISANDDPATPLRHTDDDEYHSDFDAQNPTQQLPNDKLFRLERLLSRRDKETPYDLDQKIGSYQDSVSYIGSTSGTSYGQRDKDFAEDTGSRFGSRSPAFYSITNKSNTTSPDRNIKEASFRDIFKDQEEAETQFSSTAPMLIPSANGYIVGGIGSNNGSANIKTAEC